MEGLVLLDTVHEVNVVERILLRNACQLSADIVVYSACTAVEYVVVSRAEEVSRAVPVADNAVDHTELVGIVAYSIGGMVGVQTDDGARACDLVA